MWRVIRPGGVAQLQYLVLASIFRVSTAELTGTINRMGGIASLGSIPGKLSTAL